MIIIEVNAVQFGKRVELELEERTTAAQLTKCIERLVMSKDDNSKRDDQISGYLISLDLHGILPMDSTLEDMGIRNGMRLMYVLIGSYTNHNSEVNYYDAC